MSVPYYPSLDHVLVRYYARQILLLRNVPTPRINQILEIMDLDFMRKDEEAALRMGTSPKEFGEEIARQLFHGEEFTYTTFSSGPSWPRFSSSLSEPQITTDDRKFLDDLKVSWEEK